MRYTNFIGLCIISMIASLNLASAYEYPDDNEKLVFDTIIGRLRGNDARWPYNVGDVLNSFDAEIRIPFPCQNSQKGLGAVEARIRTYLVHWNGSICPATGGCYIWGKESPDPIDNGVKYFIIKNVVMINATNLQLLEDSIFGQWVNEGLIYHELLHGQLLIDEIKLSNSWQAEACNCTFNASASGINSDKDKKAEGPHAQIGKYEGDYVDNVMKANDYIPTIRRVLNVHTMIRNFNAKIDVTKELQLMEDRGKDISTSISKAYSVDNNVYVGDYGYVDDPNPNVDMYGIDGIITSGTEGRIRVIIDPPDLSTIYDITIYYDETSDEPGSGYYAAPSGTSELIVLTICLIMINILKFKRYNS